MGHCAPCTIYNKNIYLWFSILQSDKSSIEPRDEDFLIVAHLWLLKLYKKERKRRLIEVIYALIVCWLINSANCTKNKWSQIKKCSKKFGKRGQFMVFSNTDGYPCCYWLDIHVGRKWSAKHMRTTQKAPVFWHVNFDDIETKIDMKMAFFIISCIKRKLLTKIYVDKVLLICYYVGTSNRSRTYALDKLHKTTSTPR